MRAFEIERTAGKRWRWLLADGERLVAVGGLKHTRLGAWLSAVRAKRAMAAATMPAVAEWIDTGCLPDVLTEAQLAAHEQFAHRGPARTWKIPEGSVFVCAGDLLAVLEPEPSWRLVFDCGTGRKIEGL